MIKHDDSAMGIAADMHDGVFVRSVYFTDPNGIRFELLEYPADSSQKKAMDSWK